MPRIPCGQTDKQCPWRIICLTSLLDKWWVWPFFQKSWFESHLIIESYFQIRWPLFDKISFCFIMFCPFFLWAVINVRSINHLIICRRATPPHPCHHSPMRLLAPFFHICPFERSEDIYKLIIVSCSSKSSFRSFLPFILKLIQILWRRPSPGNAWKILNGPRGSDHIYTLL